MNELIPLRLLAPGCVGEVAEIVGDPQHVQRLEELGLREGARIEMLQGGSPCIIRLSGHKLCFRHNHGLNVLVRPLVPEARPYAEH